MSSLASPIEGDKAPRKFKASFRLAAGLQVFLSSTRPLLPSRRYPDTKHNLVSFAITALKEVEITATLELLNGMYYPDFDNLLENIGELFIFTPGRSDYKPLSPSRKSFFFMLEKKIFDNIQVSQSGRQ